MIKNKQGLNPTSNPQELTIDLYVSDDATDEELLAEMFQRYKNGDDVACDTLACFFYERDEYWEAFPFVLESAKRGNSYFYYILAQLYSYDDEGWPLTNYSLALHWYEKAYAADPNDSDACYAIGRQYILGLGVETNVEQGLIWYERGKHWGSIAYWYSRGWENHPQDLNTAESYLQKINPKDMTKAEQKLLNSIKEESLRDISRLFQK